MSMFESLEDRRLFAATVYTFGSYNLSVDSSANTATLTQSGTTNTLTATGTLSGSTFTGTLVGTWNGSAISKTF